MGGVHKYDLTPDVTHLLVGDYDTAKYRHVARERPDIKPMAAGWIDAVRELWVEDHDIDLAAMEAFWMLKPFESGGGDPVPVPISDSVPGDSNPPESARKRLVCCLTGFEDRSSSHPITLHHC